MNVSFTPLRFNFDFDVTAVPNTDTGRFITKQPVRFDLKRIPPRRIGDTFWWETGPDDIAHMVQQDVSTPARLGTCGQGPITHFHLEHGFTPMPPVKWHVDLLARELHAAHDVCFGIDMGST
jgi:hypothetical protein